MKTYIEKRGYKYEGEFAFIGKFLAHQGYNKKDDSFIMVYKVDDFYNISKDDLNRISKIYGNSNVEIHTNAGVDLHSVNKGKHKNLTIKRIKKLNT